MRSWTRPDVPRLPGVGPLPTLYDTASRSFVRTAPDPVAGLYVCGITPYDATHMGHAATYLAYDTLVRLWLDADVDVRYVQNVTDIDDPLIERAAATGVDWRELAQQQTDLFRGDMEQLSIIPPDDYVAVTDTIDEVAAAVDELLRRGIAYRVEEDVYFDSAAAAAVAPWTLGEESNLDRHTMLALSAERGGDPERPGKRDPLDPLLWRAERPGEPSWASPVGAGRPGWHIECSVIAQDSLALPFTVQAGGSDLIFPHHEFSAGHAAALSGRPLARIYSHAGLVAYQGEKMSKSLGNLVLVSRLVEGGVDPRAIRLAILAQRYREDWEWTDALLREAERRLARWVAWASAEPERSSAVSLSSALICSASMAAPSDNDVGSSLLAALRTALNADLDTRAALALVDEGVAAGTPATALALDSIDALLGIRLRPRE